MMQQLTWQLALLGMTRALGCHDSGPRQDSCVVGTSSQSSVCFLVARVRPRIRLSRISDTTGRVTASLSLLTPGITMTLLTNIISVNSLEHQSHVSTPSYT